MFFSPSRLLSPKRIAYIENTIINITDGMCV